MDESRNVIVTDYIAPKTRGRAIACDALSTRYIATQYNTLLHLPIHVYNEGPTITISASNFNSTIVVEDNGALIFNFTVLLPSGTDVLAHLNQYYGPTEIDIGDSLLLNISNNTSKPGLFVLADPVNDTIGPPDLAGTYEFAFGTVSYIQMVVTSVSPPKVQYVCQLTITSNNVNRLMKYMVQSVTAIVDDIPSSPTIGSLYIANSDFSTWRRGSIYNWRQDLMWCVKTPIAGMLKYIIGGDHFSEQIVMYNGTTWISIADMLGMTHANLSDGGTLTHAVIDSYLNQSVTTSSTPAFTQVTVSSAPSAGTDVATKGYVDSKIAGVVWERSVDSIYNNTAGLPVGPSTGDRYIAQVTAHGWTINRIYEWNGSSWVETIPTTNTSVYITSLLQIYTYIDPGVWERISLSMDHNDLSNRGVLTHAVIDSYLGQAVKSTSTPTFRQVNVTIDPTISTSVMNLGYSLKWVNFSLMSRTFLGVDHAPRLEQINRTLAYAPVFTKSEVYILPFTCKMPRDWDPRTSIYFYYQYVMDTAAAPAQICWGVTAMFQNENDDTSSVIEDS